MNIDPPSLLDLLERGRRIVSHRPWPRVALDRHDWQMLADRLAASGGWTLLGLWGEPNRIHAALRDDPNATIAVASLVCGNNHFPSLAAARPGAIRLERAVRDLVGLIPAGLEDQRPWLDHGRWPVHHPLGAAEPAPANAPLPYPFLPAEGESLHQIPVGPVHAGIIEPGHFRFTAHGETVVRLEERLGYVHKGIERLMAGAPLDRAARLAARISGDSTVAYGFAFALAVEAATGTEPPPRAVLLRGVMAELERLANHFGDIGAICNDAAFALMLAECGVLRERVLRTAASCFGHRLMMDRIVPGGILHDLRENGDQMIRDLIAALRPRLAELVRVYDGQASLLDRTVGTGAISGAMVHRFGAGGVIGRASSRGFDARHSPSYPPYDDLDFPVPVRAEGDVNARIWVRIEELQTSFDLIDAMLAKLPAGEIRVPVVAAAGEGLALVEGFRGDILLWLRLKADGTVERCHPRDPSWFQWPLLEAAIEGNIVADFPLCNKSFNCSYSGHDL